LNSFENASPWGKTGIIVPSKVALVFFEPETLSHCLVLVGSRNGFECDFTIKLNLIKDLIKAYGRVT